MSELKRESIQSGFVDYAFSTLNNVVPPNKPDPTKINLVAPAVGQLVIVTPGGAKIDPATRDLLIPTVKLRHRGFIDDFPLWQGTTSDLARFYDEYTISAPTASLVAPNEVLTAYHAVIPSDICKTYFVFGRHYQSNFAKPRPWETHLRVPAQNVVGVRRIIKCGHGGATSGNDWARLELDRELTGITPLDQASRDELSTLIPDELSGLISGEPENLQVLSHPLGLPLKFARADRYRVGSPPTPPTPYKIQVDIGSGSSGAPLLFERSDRTRVLVGVVNGGDVDFRERNFVRTPTGLALDPAARFDSAPQWVTPNSNIDFE